MPNRAYEALPLVRYIVRHYHNLPDRLIFVHGERMCPHALGNDMVPLLDSVDLNHTWINLNVYMKTDQKSVNTEQIQQVWHNASIEEFLGPRPPILGIYCCAQFVVGSVHILRHPLEMWQRLDAYLSSGEYYGIPEKFVAIALEHSWVFLFTGWPFEPEPQTICDVLDCAVWRGPFARK
jgi:hypothetical protein